MVLFVFSAFFFFHCLLLGLPRSSGMASGPQCSLSHFQPLPCRGWAQFSSSCAPWRRNSWWSKACLLTPFLGGTAVPCTDRSPPKQQVPKKSKQVSGAGTLPPQGLVLRRGTDTGSSCQLSRVPGSVTHLAISLPGPAPCSSGYHSSQQPQRLAAAAR